MAIAKMKKDVEKVIEKIIVIVLVIFGLFLAYQIIKKVLGGSWTTEEIIISLFVFNLGCTFTIGLTLAKLSSDHSHLSHQFRSLASDFKERFKKK